MSLAVPSTLLSNSTLVPKGVNDKAQSQPVNARQAAVCVVPPAWTQRAGEFRWYRAVPYAGLRVHAGDQ